MSTSVELRQYAGGGLTTHIPRVIGQTAAAQQAKAPTGLRAGRVPYERVELNDQEFLQYVQEQGGPEQRSVFSRLIAWVHAQPQLEGWAERKGQVAFNVRIAGQSGYFLSTYTPRAASHGISNGRIHHNTFRKLPFSSEAERAVFFERISKIPGLDWTPSQAFERASIPTAALVTPGAMEHLLDTLAWGLERVIEATSQHSSFPDRA